jgi:histidinol-phosphate aminotransferase
MTTSTFSRRDWLRNAGLSVAGLTLATRSSTLLAQSAPPPVAAKPSRPAGPVRINYNENPFGPSPFAQAAIDAAQSNVPRYPADEIEDLLALIAKKEGVSTEHILLSAGSSDILTSVGMHVGLAGREVLTGDPAYLDVVEAALAFGGHAVKVPLNARLEYDLPALESKITDRTGVIYICNPNNPTGTVLPAAALREFCKRVSAKVPVFIDEAYLDLADDYAGRTVVGLIAEGHNVIVTRTFSKVYALAGQRIGYGIMQPAMIAKLKRYNTGSAINLLGVVAASASLRDPRHVPAMRAKISAGRDELVAGIKSLGKTCAVPQGNFVFFQTGLPNKIFAEKMEAEGVLIGRAFPPLLDWARISIGLPEEMAVCHAALKKVLG